MKNNKGEIRVYADLVESHRVDGKPRTKILASLGRIDSPEGEARYEKLAANIVKHSKLKLLNIQKDIKSDWAKTYGPSLIFPRVWQDLQLDKIIRSQFNKLEAEFDVAECLQNMIVNRLIEPTSKHRLAEWQETMYGLKQFQPQHYYRTMDHLIEHKDIIEKRLFNHLKNLFSLKVDVVLFDTTTIVYYGEGDKEEDLLARGFSKAKRSDLKQVVVGVMMSKQGIPIGHEVFSGNKNDVTCFKEIVDKISKKFQIDKVILVGDRGMINKKNIKLLDEAGYEYILGYKMRTIPKEDRHNVLSKANLAIIKKGKLHWKEVDYQGQRLLVCYNPERAKKDSAKRDEIVTKLREKFKGKVDIKSVVTNSDYKKFLIIKGDNPKINEQKIKDDALYDGVYVITSNTKLKGGEIIAGYKDLWQIEQGFRRLKSELELGPMHHWKNRRIRAHIMICFFALIVRTVFYKKLREAYPNTSYPTVLRDLKSLTASQIKVKDENLVIRTELLPGAKQAFRAIGMKYPNRILEGDSATYIV